MQYLTITGLSPITIKKTRAKTEANMLKKIIPLTSALILLSACDASQNSLPIKSSGWRDPGPTYHVVCPPDKPYEAGGNCYTSFDTVYFTDNSYSLSQEAQATIQHQAAWLREYLTVRIVVEGHADERGSLHHNYMLGERRALSVKRYLITLGITPDRIQTVSYGNYQPKKLNDNDRNSAQNRRAVSVGY